MHNTDQDPISLSRREFTLAAASTVVSLTVLGCGESSSSAGSSTRPRSKSHLATEPFDAGPVEGFKEANVYTQFHDDKDVYLVSDGKTLVALAAVCPHLACTVYWKPEYDGFKCPCHGSTFSREGINAPGVKAKTPLERLAITTVDVNGVKTVHVDPTRKFHKEKGEWDNPDAAITL
ncbi:MAG: Rieske 2Fe-2S domain-containing protein [Phycisphaera sp.]|nr:Rieske 2Fe-2S domain-containing protein [Phycisphaera sp.]